MGTLVISTWNEPDQTPGFRARIIYSQAPGDEPTTVSTAAKDEVLSVDKFERSGTQAMTKAYPTYRNATLEFSSWAQEWKRA
jgi:hypothetical protein